MAEVQANPRIQPERKVAVNSPDNTGQAAHERHPHENRWLHRGHRSHTNLDVVQRESRPWTRSYLIRRPRALQYEYITTPSAGESYIEKKEPSRVVENGRKNTRTISHSNTQSSANSVRDSQAEERSDDPAKQLSRVELFIDLVWVGIIANLSATFGQQAFESFEISTGIAVLEFMLVFLPIWRIWDYLRQYNSNYYVDDFIQRIFMVWILILAVLYGINAPFAFVVDGQSSLKILVTIYLVARGSFLLIQLWPAIYLPWLRFQWYLEAITVLLATAFWVGALFSEYPTRLGLILAANVAEHPLLIYGLSPLADRFLIKGHRKITN